MNCTLLTTLRQIIKSELNFRALFNSSPDGIIMADLSGRILEANAGMQELSGYTQAELTQKNLVELFPEFTADQAVETETKLLKKDGARVRVLLTGWTVLNTSGRPIAIGALLKKTARTKAFINESEDQYRLISEQSLLGIVIIQNLSIRYCNTAACRMIGYPETEVLAWGPEELMSVFHPDDHHLVRTQLCDTQAGKTKDESTVSICRLISNTGRYVWVDQYSKTVRYQGKPAVLTCLVDTSDKRKKEAEIAYLAYFDVLTGMPNRKSFYADLEENLKQEGRFPCDTKGAVLFLDLDKFKNVNESLGHDAGDSLLKETSRRLRDCLRRSDKIYRTGSDEFAVILKGLEKDYNIARVAEKINDAVSKPFRLREHDLYVGASIGISVFPDDGIYVEDLIRNADVAMYEAKKHRKGYRFFTPQMNKRALDRITLEKELRTAIQKNQFVIFYQLIADQEENVRGMESLIRWMHPTKGIVLPGTFISILEDMGEILTVGRWVLYRSCLEVRTWNHQYGKELFVSVNVSALQLQDDLFVHTVEDALRQSGLSPKLLKLEITESTIMKDPQSVMKKIRILQARGVEFSIDDFGTGYSSLSYLRKLPFNTLKIDRSFVRDALKCRETLEIIKAIIAMSKALRKNTMAEGIETPEQKNLLTELGCNLLQGYLFHKPMSAEMFEKRIYQWHTCH